jgi:NodT family efflux transporter outer membrane factor (OMF) lipoprotein
MYALSTLLALPPAALIDELATSEPLAALPASVPTGLPTELLLRRPDIRRSEADLRAATARIGVATADLYPKFSLSGSIGLQGPQANDLGSLAQRYWSIGPAVQWPLFRGGAIDANIQQQQAAADAAVASYKASILAALQDVESTMTAYESEQRRTSSLDQSVRASTDSLRLSTSLYEAGKTDFLSVLNAQRSLLDAESSRLDSHRLSLTSLIALYKALGGGWDPDTEAAPKGASQN